MTRPDLAELLRKMSYTVEWAAKFGNHNVAVSIVAMWRDELAAALRKMEQDPEGDVK